MSDSSFQKLPDPKSFEAAIARIYGAMTPQGAADVIGCKPGIIYAAADEDRREMLNLRQALALDVAYLRLGFGQAPIYDVYGRLLKAETETDGQGAEAPRSAPTDLLLRLVGEIGCLTTTYRDVMDHDGARGAHLSKTSRHLVNARARAAMDLLHAFVGAIDRHPSFSAGGEEEKRLVPR